MKVPSERSVLPPKCTAVGNTPLRRRKKDITALLQHFLGDDLKKIDRDQMACLLNYDWPGNIRELENLATYYKTLSSLPEYILQAVDSQEPLYPRRPGICADPAYHKG